MSGGSSSSSQQQAPSAAAPTSLSGIHTLILKLIGSWKENVVAGFVVLS